MSNEALKEDLENSFKNNYQEEIFQSNKSGTGFEMPENKSPATYYPDRLNARHREILRLHCLGYNNVTIANMLGVTSQVVSYTINCPLGTEFIAEINEARTGSVKDVHNRLQEMSPLAAEVMLDLMDSADERIKLSAADKVLEMAGHKNTKHEHLHAHLTKEDIEAIKHTVNGPKVVPEPDKTLQIEDAVEVEDATEI